MIAFGSQRGSGGDLATHLSNAEDNEYVEIADLRGSIADDLHGAFAEWEAQAHAMTRAKNYLYSLSVNPDPAQGRLSREQYEDYIARAEESLGLAGQPRAVIFHIKESRDGSLREHCHIIWSRTDIQDLKSIPIAFDKQKLMMVAREFARDHGLSLPDGYETGRAKAAQLSLYEKAQSDQTGLSREERMEFITDLWRQSDNAKAFVAGLEDNGYILATGRRPYVLVDIYGHMNALPKMIDDKSVRTKDIRAFLEKDFPAEVLPSVEEARSLASQHREEREGLKFSEKIAEQLEILKRSQDERRAKLVSETVGLKERLDQERLALKTQHGAQFHSMRAQQTKEVFETQFRRAQNTPKGLVRFLAKVSGIAFMRQQFHRFEDRKCAARQEEQRKDLEMIQVEERRKQTHLHQLNMMERHRKTHAQEKIFTREKRSIETAQQKSQAMRMRRGHDHMPALELTLGPRGRKAMPHKAMKRYFATTVKELNVKAKPKAPEEPINLRDDFSFAAKPGISKKTGAGKAPEFGSTPKKDGRDGGRKR
jgi:MobA/VirD2-like, nuclease domain